MEFKWYAIMIIGVVTAVSMSDVMSSKGDSDAVKIEAAKAGLEQCRMNNYRTSPVIWVKDCKAYTETIKD